MAESAELEPPAQSPATPPPAHTPTNWLDKK